MHLQALRECGMIHDETPDFANRAHTYVTTEAAERLALSWREAVVAQGLCDEGQTGEELGVENIEDD